MKKLLLLVSLSLGVAASSAFAHNEEPGQFDYNQGGRNDGISYHADHLNRMLAHVQGEARHYGAGWRVRRELGHISGEVNHVNFELHHGSADRRHLRGEIEHIHAELHNVETGLHVRASEWYQWR